MAVPTSRYSYSPRDSVNNGWGFGSVTIYLPPIVYIRPTGPVEIIFFKGLSLKYPVA